MATDARDSLSLAGAKAHCVFVGRLPRRSPLDALAQLFVAAGVPPLRLIPSRETYLFVELQSADAVAAACRQLNGAALGGSALVVQPAASLTKLFIGGIHRRVDAATIHEAISAVEPVRLVAGGPSHRAAAAPTPLVAPDARASEQQPAGCRRPGACARARARSLPADGRRGAGSRRASLPTPTPPPPTPTHPSHPPPLCHTPPPCRASSQWSCLKRPPARRTCTTAGGAA
jgi:hypothetical protein